MITMEEVNQALRDTWTLELKKEESLPKQLAKSYKAWVRGLIQNAAAGLQQNEAAGANDQEAAQGAGGGEAPQE